MTTLLDHRWRPVPAMALLAALAALPLVAQTLNEGFYVGLASRVLIFALAGAMAGLAGALAANQAGFVSPSLLQWSHSGMLMMMVILGGIGHLYGGIVGAAVFLLLEEVLSTHTVHWQFALGAVLLAVVLAAPDGLAGLVRRRAKP